MLSVFCILYCLRCILQLLPPHHSIEAKKKAHKTSGMSARGRKYNVGFTPHNRAAEFDWMEPTPQMNEMTTSRAAKLYSNNTKERTKENITMTEMTKQNIQTICMKVQSEVNSLV